MSRLKYTISQASSPSYLGPSETVVRDYFSDGTELRLSVRVVARSRRAAVLAWWPPGAFAERDMQVVYAPQGAR